MKTICSIACLILLTGCVGVRYSQTSAAGVKTSVTVVRIFANTDYYKAVLDPSGASLEASKSGVDGKALGTAVGAAAAAAIKGSVLP